MVAVLATNTSSDDGSLGPQVDERIDVGGERIWLVGDVEDVVKGHVGVKRPHEKEGSGTWVECPDSPGRHGPAEVIAHDGQPTPRRTVGSLGVKGDDQLPLRAAVHVDSNVLRHDTLREWHEVLGDGAQNLARIGRRGIDERQLHDERRRRCDIRLHGRPKEGLLRLEVPQHSRGRHTYDGGDVRERGGIETPFAEDVTRGLKQIIPGDARWPAHL
jgi:hypothetical protein